MKMATIILTIMIILIKKENISKIGINIDSNNNGDNNYANNKIKTTLLMSLKT